MHNIMVATDGSEGANRAVKAGAELARAVAGDLSIVTIGSTRSLREQSQFERIEGDAANAAEVFARQIVSDAEKLAQSAGVETLTTDLAWGDPAQSIIEFVRQKKADTLVIGRRGAGRLSGLILGSVSQKLASLAPCTVVVVP